LAQVGGVGVVSFIPALLVLIIDGIRVGSTRDVAVVTMGQLIESTGFVIKPFNEHPGLLSLMLRILAEETGPVRAELLRTLGVLGALDPHAHRENEERLHGQGLLSMEGVRGVGRAGETKSPEELQAKVIDKTGASVGGGGVFPGLDSDDPLPAANLTTASDNFYPTVALNALLRVLRDPSMVSKPFLFLYFVFIFTFVWAIRLMACFFSHHRLRITTWLFEVSCTSSRRSD
jgi:FKBP12-rapamycin complex-associated protein